MKIALLANTISGSNSSLQQAITPDCLLAHIGKI